MQHTRYPRIPLPTPPSMRPASTLPYRGLHLVTASPGRPNAAQRPENAERLRLFHGTSKEIVLVLALGVAAVLMAVQF